MAHAIFASDFAHAKISATWNAILTYIAGDFVLFGNTYYKCVIDTAVGESPTSHPAKWENLNTATRHTPLTTSVDLWKAFGSGDDPTSDGFYETMFVDFNIVQVNYDRTDVANEFEAVSIKDIEDFLTDPALIPTGEIKDGKRWLVNNGAGTPWAGHNNQIAQWDEFKEGGAGWQFSVSPVTDDTVHARKLGQVLRFDGVAWGVEWDLVSDADKASPFHPVKAIRLAAGPDGVANSAVEFEFDWNFTRKAGNLASRWAGWSFRFHAPQRSKGSLSPGDIFNIPYLDTENLEVDPVSGSAASWNSDGSINLGAIRGIEFKTEFDMRDAANNRVDGMPNVPGL
jgi:hypothetical protein